MGQNLGVNVVRKIVNFWLVFIIIVLAVVIVKPFSALSVEAGLNSDLDKKLSALSKKKTLSAEEKVLLSKKYQNLVSQAIKYNKYKEALYYLKDLLKLNPDSEHIYNDLSSTYLALAFHQYPHNNEKLGESEAFKQALYYAKQNINRQGDFPNSYNGLINAHVAVRDYDTAINIAKTSCYVAPHFQNRCNKVAELYLLQGDFKQAVNFYKKLATKLKSSDNTWIYKKIGVMYRAKGYCKESYTYLNKVYKMESTSENLENLIQICYERPNSI